jgi:small-conductance mechanosensitive channel
MDGILEKSDLSLLEAVGVDLLVGTAFAAAIALFAYVIGRREHPTRLGLFMLFFLGVWYMGHGIILRLADLDQDFILKLMEKSIAAAFWAVTACTLNEIIRQIVWYGILASKTGTRAPHIIRTATSVLIYMTSLIVFLYYVFDLPVTGLVASSGVVAFVLGYAAQSTLG